MVKRTRRDPRRRRHEPMERADLEPDYDVESIDRPRMTFGDDEAHTAAEPFDGSWDYPVERQPMEADA